MSGIACVLAWSSDESDRECLVFDTFDGCDVQMTVNGRAVLAERCACVADGLRIATDWRARYESSLRAPSCRHTSHLRLLTTHA